MLRRHHEQDAGQVDEVKQHLEMVLDHFKV
jgi:hypothetical protein